MASQQKTVDFVVEQMAGAGRLTAKKMFGEYGLYLDGRMFALVCDDQLFMKPTPAGRAYAPDLAEGVPYPGATPCLLVTGDRWDDADWLAELARVRRLRFRCQSPKSPRRADWCETQKL